MALFKVIRTTDDLPPIGPTTRAAEAQTVDFKSGYNPRDHAEMAKDIAAFTNALGGALVIGASRDDEPLAYPGLPRAFAEELAAGFDEALARHVSPRPAILESAIFAAPAPAVPDRFILSVNVHPFADQLVGARVGPNTWRFPIRVGANTNDLEPAMLPLYTTAVRRNMILLGEIQPADHVQISYFMPSTPPRHEPVYSPIRGLLIDPRKNALAFHFEHDSTTTYRIPLDDVVGVWDGGHHAPNWTVRITGHFRKTAAALIYHSSTSDSA